MSRFSLIFLFLFFVLISSSRAEWSGEIGFSSSLLTPSSPTFDPNNRWLQTPNSNTSLDLKAEFKHVAKDWKFIARPRFLKTEEKSTVEQPLEERAKSEDKWDLTDAFLEWNASTSTQWTAGLFVDGWGPAEYVNPTNPFFHLRPQSKSFLFKEKGQVLGKAVWNPTAKWSLSALIEPISNNEPSFRAEDEFSPIGIIRSEWQSDDSSKVLGAVAGTEAKDTGFFGEYVQLRHDPTGISVYFEARHSVQPDRFEIERAFGYRQINLRTQQGTRTFSVSGIRYEGDFDARIEWIQYQLGYSVDEWNELVSAASQMSPFLQSNAGKFSRPGLEFLTKNWWSVSLRIPNMGPWSDWQWTHRFLFSVGDEAFNELRSGLYQSTLEMPAFDAWTFFFENQNYFLDSGTDLYLALESSYTLGFRWAW